MNGYSEAKCAFCPTPPYPREARRVGCQGTVIVLAVARTDGKLSDFRVLEHTPGNLIEAVLRGLKLWRLTRATDPNRSPAAVRQTFQVAYSLS
jgi:outer membrane biosynthesis protein TonB